MSLPENVYEAICRMFMCDNLEDHLTCYHSFYEDLKECTFIVFSENEGSKLPESLCTDYDHDFAIINLGFANRYYAMNQQIYKEMIEKKRSDYFIDICVDLDTQAVSYLKNIFVEFNEVSHSQKMNEVLQYLQLPEINYSCAPYMVENAAKKDSINRIECYKNIKSFMLFKAFHYSKFMQNGICEYDRLEEEIQLDADALFHGMFSEKYALSCEKFYRMQESLYVLLLKTICIEFANPKKSPQNKIMELFDFVNTELGYFADRELQICYYYFRHDEKIKKFFKKVQKNSNDLFGTINGMSWDLIHVRIIEQEFAVRPTEQVRYAIHVLLTFDNGLKEVLQINPIEQIAFYKDIPIPKLKYCWCDKIPGAKEKLMSENNKKMRHHTFKTMHVEKLKTALEKELHSLCHDTGL